MKRKIDPNAKPWPRPIWQIFGTLCVSGQMAGKIATEVVIYRDEEGNPVTPTSRQVENDSLSIVSRWQNRNPGNEFLTWTGWGLIELIAERRRRGLEPPGKSRPAPERKFLQNVPAVCVNCGREFVIPQIEATFGLPGAQPRFGCPACLAGQKYDKTLQTCEA